MTIHSYTAAGNFLGSAPSYNDAANATQIEEHEGCDNIEVLECSTGNATGGVILPDVDVGSAIRMYVAGPNSVMVYFPAGHTVNGQSFSAAPPQSNANYYGNISPQVFLVLRKVDSTAWAVESNNSGIPF